MSHFPSDNPTSWLDEALRDVPLPPDLIARLRRLGVDNDGELGESLRRVALPQDLIARLKQIPDDAELDRRMSDVPVRGGFLAGLKEIPLGSEGPPASTAAPAMANARGAQEPVRIAPARQDSAAADRLTRWIVAASLLAAATLAVLGFVGDVGPVARGFGAAAVPDGRLSVLDEEDALPVLPPEGRLRPLAASGSNPAEPPDSLARRYDRLPSDVVEQHASVLDDAGGLAADPLLDAPLSAMEQLAMPDSVSGPRTMDLLLPGGASGLSPPTAQGFDWTSLLRDGAFPFVAPADHPQLSMLSLPLVTRSGSFRGFHELLTRDEPLAPQDVRTEDFLAAVDYRYPLPDTQAVALYASGGPSPWSPVERRFLLLGVQARGEKPRKRPPVDVTFVIDASLSAPGLDALDAFRQAAARALAALEPEDRVSRVLAAQRPVWLAQGLAPVAEDLSVAVEQLARVEPQPIVDVVPALEAAVRHAGGGASRRKLVVCVTSDLAYLGRADEERLAKLVAAGAAEGLRLDIVRLSPVGRRDDVSGRLAQAGGGEVHVAGGPRELWAALYPLVTGQSPVVARDVSLTLQFDSTTVENYRVLGHEMHAVGPARGGTRTSVDLLLQDTGVVMVELTLRHSVAGEVATARLEWHDPQTGERETVVQRIGAAQFATTLGEATLPVQRATVAAMTAELLRRVPAVPANASLQDVVDEAAALDSRLWDEAWLVDLVEAIGTAEMQHGMSRNRGAVRPSGS